MKNCIEIFWDNGWYIISDSEGHRMQYLYYSKREALRRFKREFGWRYKHGVEIIDYTRQGVEE